MSQPNNALRADLCQRYSDLLGLRSTSHPDFDLKLGELLVAFYESVKGSAQKKQRTHEDRLAIVREYIASDEPLEALVSRHDISRSTLYSWAKQAGVALSER